MVEKYLSDSNEKLKFAPTLDKEKIKLLKSLFEHAASDQRVAQLLEMLCTPDERDLLITRMNVFYELLNQELSQRDIAKKLGTGIATVTRGSMALKQYQKEDQIWLQRLLEGCL